MDHSCSQIEVKRSDFPKDFIFGAGTSAYQVEGAWNADGKGRSNWDHFTLHTPGGTADGSNGCVALDQYNMFKDDVDLMKKLGLDSYRFSIAWSRILPGGKLCGGVSKEGIKYYNDLIDVLLAQGDSGIEPYIVAHHLILAHAHAVNIYRKKYQEHQGGKIGMSNVSVWFYPFDPKTPEDVEAASRAVDFMLGWFVAPVIKGDYPPSMRKNVGVRLPKFKQNEVTLVKDSCDFLGINYYTTYYAKNQPKKTGVLPNYDNDLQVEYLFDRGGVPIGPQPGSAWLYVVPDGIYHVTRYIKETYNNPEIYITENGVNEINDKTVTISKARIDETRIKYHRDHLAKLRDARNIGVRVKGYFIWSLLDNFEWAEGYTIRFGIFYADYVNGRLTRFPKDSAVWWMNFLNKTKSPWNKLPWKPIFSGKLQDEKTEQEEEQHGSVKRPRCKDA
ncbi:unnamed protein product [Fraxinus pennsylvanica]|uniref:Beta-glucosidase n=1 Tax=Fraxinus pennsylvanica TaxID=56036 RepID=A0AAD1Z209_9LAMI|nr:unnamed protein product [Fraxinus pennsylvanica]